MTVVGARVDGGRGEDEGRVLSIELYIMLTYEDTSDGRLLT